MRLAYLIIAHNNPNILERLVKSIRCEQATVFIHIDLKSDIKQFLQLDIYNDVIFIPNRVPVYWGDYSQVEATINLLRAAYKHGVFDYYQLLSGVDYPLRSNKFIIEALSSNNCEYMEYFKMPVSHKPLNRLENYWLTGAYRHPSEIKRFFLKIPNKILQWLAHFYKRNYKKHIGEIQPYAGSADWTLSGACVDYILNFIENNPDYLRAFKYTLCPDEMFFQTIVLNSPFRKHIAPILNFSDWSDRHVQSPPEINEDHLRILKENKHFLFARKFSNSNAYLFDYIDRHLRKLDYKSDAIEGRLPQGAEVN